MDIMKIAYIYPEHLPSTNARSISVINSAYEISKLCQCTLFITNEQNIPNTDIYNNYNILNNNLTIKKISKKFLFLKSNKFFNRNLLRETKNSNYDIFYVRHLKLAQFLIEHKQENQKVIFECHEIFYKANSKIKSDEAFVYENVSGLVFINETLKRHFCKEFNLSNIPQKVIHNGTSFNFEYKYKDFNNINELFYIGNFYTWKGLEFLIQTMNHLRMLKLNIIGTGNELEVLQKLREELNLTKHINFLGFKNTHDVKDILLNSKLTIIPNIPSRYSNFSSPIKLYEYMSTSNIVIAADMETIKEVIIDGKNGFLFESGSLKSLKGTIQKVISLPNETLQKIAKNAYNTSKEFTWERRAQSIVSFAKELMK